MIEFSDIKHLGGQVTAQDVSTMMRCEQRSIIFLINNGGYTIEVEIHDGPYNVIKNWNYTGLVDAIHNGEGKCWTMKVSCFDFRYVTRRRRDWMDDERSEWFSCRSIMKRISQTPLK